METRTLKSCSKFETPRFAASPDVIGKRHEFRFENASITLLLPTTDEVDCGNTHESAAITAARRSSDNEPLEFSIHKVEVVVAADFVFSVPMGALQQSPNAFDLFTVDQHKRLDGAVSQHQRRAEGAFQHWARIMQWVCDDHRIARDNASGCKSRSLAYLVDVETDHRVWCHPAMYTIPGCRRVEPREWLAAQEALADGALPPIHIELKHEALAQMEHGDYRRAILDMAVACETYLRSIVVQQLPSNLNSRIATYIEEGNISQFVNKFVPELLSEDGKREFKRLKKMLFRLFDRRNKLMHSGAYNNLTHEECHRFAALTADLLAIDREV